MKRTNMFTCLPQKDQRLILDLCRKLPYREVVEQLALPRDQGGLSLTTTESSLCKFFTRYDYGSFAIEAVGQFAAAIQVHQQGHGQANFEAILALVQNRILKSLREGHSLVDLDKDFRSLQRVQKCFLEDLKTREDYGEIQDAYLEHVKTLTRAGDKPDFVVINDDAGANTVLASDSPNDQRAPATKPRKSRAISSISANFHSPLPADPFTNNHPPSAASIK